MLGVQMRRLALDTRTTASRAVMGAAGAVMATMAAVPALAITQSSTHQSQRQQQQIELQPCTQWPTSQPTIHKAMTTHLAWQAKLHWLPTLLSPQQTAPIRQAQTPATILVWAARQLQDTPHALQPATAAKQQQMLLQPAPHLILEQQPTLLSACRSHHHPLQLTRLLQPTMQLLLATLVQMTLQVSLSLARLHLLVLLVVAWLQLVILALLAHMLLLAMLLLAMLLLATRRPMAASLQPAALKKRLCTLTDQLRMWQRP